MFGACSPCYREVPLEASLVELKANDVVLLLPLSSRADTTYELHVSQSPRPRCPNPPLPNFALLPQGHPPRGVQLELQRGPVRLAHVLQGLRAAAGAVQAPAEVFRREEHHLRHLLAERRRALHSWGEWPQVEIDSYRDGRIAVKKTDVHS